MRQREHPLYSTWRGMLSRCQSRRDKQWADYGGRGISVCESWSQRQEKLGRGAPWAPGFLQFLKDMGPRPDGLTLNRVDNDGPYAPWNCSWATPAEQAKNRRSRRCYNAAGLKYVRRRGSRFEAYASMSGKYTYIGTYDTPEQAHLAACAHRLENYWRI